jgi:replicative DNA helicase
VIVASQFNREITHRGNDAPPTLSDLKGSGSLEQDATMVVAIRLQDWGGEMLRRFPENLDPHTHRLAAPEQLRIFGVKFYVLKQRNGPTGVTREIKWDKATNTYSPLDLFSSEGDE